ncbi:hypothetical protein JCM19046_1886 [Bacillus sp. JCM 19046]|nr:hypothetical protein JCM19045_697 [Bacillus sp. JCM 19045]GAF17377.1 hypothetical protein JCM19046_1886 [Bacillus sp. JCM 19046]
MQINFFSLIVAIGALTLSSCQFLSSDDHSGTSAILLVTDKYEEENAYLKKPNQRAGSVSCSFGHLLDNLH